jgi:multidrug transporter EmrE-like cation transporter
MSENLPSETPTQDDDTRRKNTAWIGGAVLIVIGIVFLLQNISGINLGNWWALFILIPALGSLATAWRIYRTHGRLTSAARGPLVGGVILLLVAAIFLFNLDWGKVWPLFLIIAGVGALATSLLGD